MILVDRPCAMGERIPLEVENLNLVEGLSQEARHTPAIGLIPGRDRLTLGGVPREQKMLKGHLPRVIYHQICWYAKTARFYLYRETLSDAGSLTISI